MEVSEAVRLFIIRGYKFTFIPRKIFTQIESGML